MAKVPPVPEHLLLFPLGVGVWLSVAVLQTIPKVGGLILWVRNAGRAGLGDYSAVDGGHSVVFSWWMGGMVALTSGTFGRGGCRAEFS